jgi:arginyl-tRNA synthetase
LDADSIAELERIYKLASARAAEDEQFAAAARAELAKLQAGDTDCLAVWEKLVDASRCALERVYQRLDVHFDEWLGESAYHDALPGVVELLLEKGFAREDAGAICVFWGELAETLGDAIPKNLAKQKEPFIIRKKDGAFLYSTTDLAAVAYRLSHFGADRAVYVVDARQSQHFKQLFTLAALVGHDIVLEHVGFGVVMRGGKPLKTRDASGEVITLASLLDEAISRAEARMRQEGIDVPDGDIAEVARIVGIGAIKYADLRQNRASDYEFDWDKMISFKGNAGPYLQYAYARTRAIFRKGEVDEAQLAGPIVITEPTEKALARRLLRFGDVIHAAAVAHHPHLIGDHLYALARAFSGFYEACPVLKADDEQRASRLALVALSARQIRAGLGLLGIHTVERM